jgi:hypothetical protein
MNFKAKKDIMNPVRIVFFLVIIWGISACNDPTAVGAGLLEEDQATVGFTDTLSVEAYTSIRERVQVYSGFSTGQISSFLLGNFTDPLFGRVSAQINAQLYPASSNPGFVNGTGIDSIRLLLPINISRIYGKLDDNFDIEVYQLDDNIRDDQTYFSDYEAMTKMELLGSYSAIPNLDTTSFIRYSGDTADTLAFTHISIPLDVVLADSLNSWYNQDSTVFSNDSLFLALFNGLQIRATSENSGLLNFGLVNSELAGMYIFYKDTADVSRNSYFTFTSGFTASFPQYQHDYSGSFVEPFIGELGEAQDSLLFVQGMSGLEVKIQLPASLDNLRGVIVNKAELEFYIREFETGDTIFTPVNQMALSIVEDEETLVVIEDIQSSIDRFLPIASTFGGFPMSSEDSEPDKYIMNISTHLQRVLDGEEDKELLLTPFSKVSSAARVVLYGSSHPEYGVKLKVTYTGI